MDNIVFDLLGYRMSLLELLAVLTGLAAVWLAARSNILTWFFALINAVLFFILFYQVNLYSAMALQVFFFCNALYGWYNWRRDSSGEKKPVELLKHKQRVIWLAAIMAGTIALGLVMSRVHLWLPGIFPEKATFVYTDAMIAVMSIVASVLLAKLKLENWVLWILIDMMSIAMYSMRGVMLVSIQYVIFLGMATYGLIQWKKKVDKMKNLILIMLMAITVIASSCKEKENLFIVSGYTAENQPDIALGILKSDATPEMLVQFTCGDNPSFFTSGKDNLYYFINEVDSFNLKTGGGITTLRIDKIGRTIEKVSSINQGGEGPCHVILSGDGGYLITANYGSGSVSVVKLNEEGIPEEVTDVIKYGEKSHPHMTHYNKRNNTYYVTDLGLDRIYLLVLDTVSGRLINGKAPYLKTDEGAGPRHMASDASDVNLYVINELNSTISVYNILPAIPELKQTVSSLPEGYAEKSFCADIHLSPDSKKLYGSNRGHNSIAVFNIARDGKLTDSGHYPCSGNWPRNFTVQENGKLLLVANQKSGTLSVLKAESRGAELNETSASLPFNAPACVKFIE